MWVAFPLGWLEKVTFEHRALGDKERATRPPGESRPAKGAFVTAWGGAGCGEERWSLWIGVG